MAQRSHFALIVIFFDVTMAFACFFGAGAAVSRFKWLQSAILFVESLIVLWIGFGLIRSKPDGGGAADCDFSIGKAIYTACVVTWFNPQAIIDGTMMLGAFYVTFTREEAAAFIAGVAAASCLWFSSVTLALSFFRDSFSIRLLRWINVLCGAVIIFYGAKLFLDFVGMVR